jgi:amidohydrolase/hippurate hydrolase
MSKLTDLEESINREITAVWQHLHQNPELSMQEFNTSDYIENALRQISGLDRIKRVGKTGLWVELKGTAPRKGKEEIIIALRGDMDALPIQEKNDLPYKSTVPNVMHACGHDVHTSTLLGAVRTLEKYRDQIPGTIWFFFQPGEETLQGALTFLADPEIDFTKIKAIAAAHVGGRTEAGKVRLRSGPTLASADLLRFRITGQGGHAASPHTARDPIVAAAHLIVQLQTLVSREVKPTEPAVLSLCHIEGGLKDNIIPESVFIEGTLRTVTKETRDYLLDAIKRVNQGIAQSLRVSVELELTNGSPPLVSDPEITKIAERAAKKILGEENIEFSDHAEMGGEDFAFFADKVPGTFISLGTKSKDGREPQMHSPEFYTDPGTIRTGILIYSAFALEYFGVEF